MVIGPQAEVNRDSDFALYSVHPTLLAKRWFGADYQGNVYLFGGWASASGINNNSLGNDQMAIYGGVMADWETRSLLRAIETVTLMPAILAINLCRRPESDLHPTRVTPAICTLG